MQFSKSKWWVLSSFLSFSYSSIHSICQNDTPLSVLILAVDSFDVWLRSRQLRLLLLKNQLFVLLKKSTHYLLSINALSEGISGLLVRFILQYKMEQENNNNISSFLNMGLLSISTPNAYKNMFAHFLLISICVV